VNDGRQCVDGFNLVLFGHTNTKINGKNTQIKYAKRIHTHMYITHTSYVTHTSYIQCQLFLATNAKSANRIAMCININNNNH